MPKKGGLETLEKSVVSMPRMPSCTTSMKYLKNR